MNNFVVIILDDGTELYHTYACAHDRMYYDGLSFWVYNPELAEANGATACPDCFPVEEVPAE